MTHPFLGLAMLALLPLVAALHRYGVDYGYRGLSKAQARDGAKWTAIGMAVFVCAPLAIMTALR